MKHLALFTTFILLASCATVKRNGYYQTRIYKVKPLSLSSPEKKDKFLLLKPAQRIPYLLVTDLSVPTILPLHVASHASTHLNKSVENQSRITKKEERSCNNEPLQDSCDHLIMKGGEEVEGKVLEINETEIKYKRCDNPDGPTFVVSREKVLIIKYKNGTKEVFGTEKSVKRAKLINPGDGTNRIIWAIGFVLLIIGLILILFISILMGAIVVALGILLMVI